jgi:hypothetical protein
MTSDFTRERTAAGVLQQAEKLDALVAGCLQDAVAQLQVLATEVLQRTADLQRWADTPGAPPGLADALQPQVASLLRVGQFHDIFGQAAQRCLAIQERRAQLVTSLVASLQEEGHSLPAVMAGSHDLLRSCRDEQARHAGIAAAQCGSVELF